MGKDLRILVSHNEFPIDNYDTIEHGNMTISRYMDAYCDKFCTYGELCEDIENMKDDLSKADAYKLLSLAKSLIIFSSYGDYGISEPSSSLYVLITYD